MPKRNKKESRRRDVYLDNENWEKLDVLSSTLPGTPSISGLIREAIHLYLKKYESQINSELKMRKQETMRKVVSLSKQSQQTNDKSST